MSKAKHYNHYIPQPVVGENYWKCGRIKVPPSTPVPSTAECIKLVNAMVRRGLVSFQGKEDENDT